MTSDAEASSGGLHSGRLKAVFARSFQAVVEGAGQEDIEALLGRVHPVDLLVKKAGVRKDHRYYNDITALQRDAALGWLHLAACTLHSADAGMPHVSFLCGNAWSATATIGPENVTSNQLCLAYGTAGGNFGSGVAMVINNEPRLFVLRVTAAAGSIVDSVGVVVFHPANGNAAMTEIQLALGLPAALKLTRALAAADTGYVSNYQVIEMGLDEEQEQLARRMVASQGHMGTHAAAAAAATAATAAAAAAMAAAAAATVAAATTAAAARCIADTTACKNPKCMSMVKGKGAGYCSMQCLNAAPGPEQEQQVPPLKKKGKFARPEPPSKSYAGPFGTIATEEGSKSDCENPVFLSSEEEGDQEKPPTSKFEYGDGCPAYYY